MIKKINDFSEEEKNWILQDGKFAFSTWGKWGVYEIINDEIFIKQQLIGAGHRVFQEKGKVINNFTYFISEQNNFYPNKIEEYSKSGYYYFRQTVNKPDSLNKFFK